MSDSRRPTRERWSELEPLLDRLLDEPVERRSALLDLLCGADQQLRAELLGLLEGGPVVDQALDRPAFERFGTLLEDTSLSDALRDRYVIEREIGSGGMAIVYLAHDVRHDRAVAIKVLRTEIAAGLSSDRFLAEIRTTANLQHPHILGLIDSGVADGRLYYVMPYVTGESLRARLNREKPLPVEAAVRITCEVARALDYAHRQGIIHRDIKPENILLQDGQALVADFGIALANTGSRTERHTRTGLLLGTPQYMSPEQLRGELVLSARSDVYALGCVLQELLTGAPPSAGVERSDGAPLQSLRITAPVHVADAVHRALQQEPDDRFASCQEFADALSTLPAYDATNLLSGSARTTVPMYMSWRAWGLAAVLVVVGSFAGWRLGAHTAAPPTATRVSHLSVVLPPGSRLPEYSNGIALSPDGSTLVYTGVNRDGQDMLFLKESDAAEARELTDTDSARYPFFSPDGRSVGFFAGHTLRKVTLANGAVDVIVELGDRRSGSDASWDEDGFIYFGEYNFFRTGVGIRRVSEKGGPIELLTKPDAARGELSHSAPQRIPGTPTLMYTVRSGSMEAVTSRIVATRLGSSVVHTVIDGAVRARSIGDGRLMYQVGTELFAGRLNTDSLVLSESSRILSGLYQTSDGQSWAGISDGAPWSVAGEVLAYREALTGKRSLVWVSRDGTREAIPVPPKKYLNPVLSPRGDRLAIMVQGATRRMSGSTTSTVRC